MASTVVITSAVDAGNDRLEVTGTVDNGDGSGPRAVIASGWVSATTHYYPPDQYTGTPLMLISGATPRAMTTEEQLAYEEALLLAVVEA